MRVTGGKPSDKLNNMGSIPKTRAWLLRHIVAAACVEALAISINTFKTHRAAIFQKMDVTSVVELVKKTDLLR